MKKVITSLGNVNMKSQVTEISERKPISEMKENRIKTSNIIDSITHSIKSGLLSYQISPENVRLLTEIGYRKENNPNLFFVTNDEILDWFVEKYHLHISIKYLFGNLYIYVINYDNKSGGFCPVCAYEGRKRTTDAAITRTIKIIQNEKIKKNSN